MSKKVKWIIFTFSLLLILSVIIVTLSLVNPPTIKVANFEECVAAGNPVMESHPRQCKDEKTGKIFIEEIEENETEIFCTPENRNAEACIQLYQPVCAYDKDRNKIQTYSNSCFACINENVFYYAYGEC